MARDLHSKTQQVGRLPSLRLHPLDLLNSLLEREAEELPPPLATLFLPHRTLAHIKLLVSGLLPDLVRSDGGSQASDCRGEVEAALRLNLHLPTECRAELKLQFAGGQLAGRLVAAGVVGTATSTDVSGDAVRKFRAVGCRCCFSFGIVAQVQCVEECVEVFGLAGCWCWCCRRRLGGI